MRSKILNLVIVASVVGMPVTTALVRPAQAQDGVVTSMVSWFTGDPNVVTFDFEIRAQPERQVRAVFHDENACHANS